MFDNISQTDLEGVADKQQQKTANRGRNFRAQRGVDNKNKMLGDA